VARRAAVRHARTVTATTIVVPLNGSPDGERAVPIAQRLAPHLDGSGEQVAVVLVLALEGPDEPVARHDAQRYLDAVARSLAPSPVTTAVHAGNPADAIVETIAGVPQPLLCMSTHGRVGPVAAVLGNVAEAVTHECDVPAVLVGPSCELATGTAPVARLVACYDASEESDGLVPVIGEWARRLDAVVDVVMVLHRDGTFLGDHDATEPRRRAEAFTGRLAEAGTAATLVLLDGLDPARTIADHCGQSGASLVLAARHRRTPLTSKVLGHVNTRIAHHSPCPVLVLSPSPTA